MIEIKGTNWEEVIPNYWECVYQGWYLTVVRLLPDLVVGSGLDTPRRQALNGSFSLCISSQTTNDYVLRVMAERLIHHVDNRYPVRQVFP